MLAFAIYISRLFPDLTLGRAWGCFKRQDTSSHIQGNQAPAPSCTITTCYGDDTLSNAPGLFHDMYITVRMRICTFIQDEEVLVKSSTIRAFAWLFQRLVLRGTHGFHFNLINDFWRSLNSCEVGYLFDVGLRVSEHVLVAKEKDVLRVCLRGLVPLQHVVKPRPIHAPV